jgi:hypothetical protein
MSRYKLLSLLLVSSLALASAQDRGVVMARLTSQFRLVDSNNLLFEVNNDYAAQSAFDAAGRLLAIRIAPKFRFGKIHRDWQTSDPSVRLGPGSLNELMEHIQKIEATGPSVSPGSVGITLNSQTRYWYEHRDAVVERVVTNQSVVGLTIWYFHEVSGVVRSREAMLDMYSIGINGKSYWVSKESFDAVAVGTTVEVRVAGPLDIW